MSASMRSLMRASQPSSSGSWERRIGELIGQVLLLDVAALVVVRQLVADTDAVVAHPPMARVLEMLGTGSEPSWRTSSTA